MTEEMTDSMRQAMSLDGDRTKLESFYDRWAESYDEDVAGHGYGLPQSMVESLAAAIDLLAANDPACQHFTDPSTVVLDAACGTGQVGRALHVLGYETIDGIDLSEEMIVVAKTTGVYRTLEAGIDLTQTPAAHLVAHAEIMTVGGVFTVGHIPPDSLRPMSAMVRPGGLMVVSTRRAYQDETGYADISARLVGEGLFSLVLHSENMPYTMDSTGDYWVYRIPA